MVARSITAAIQERGAFLRVVVASLLTALVLSLTAGDRAFACPPGTKTHHATLQQKLRSVDVIGLLVLTASNTYAPAAYVNDGCGGVPSGADPCCKSGCCSAGAAIADIACDGSLDLQMPATYNGHIQDRLTPSASPTHFRPPQSAI
jgi:hypothetical protein